MQKALSILAILTIYLPEIRQALGERWPAFVEKLQAQASLFKHLEDEVTLSKAADQLYGFFMMDEATREILTRPSIIELFKRPRPEAKPVTAVKGIANRFYLLCEKTDEFIDQAETTHQTQPEAKKQEQRPKRE